MWRRALAGVCPARGRGSRLARRRSRRARCPRVPPARARRRGPTTGPPPGPRTGRAPPATPNGASAPAAANSPRPSAWKPSRSCPRSTFAALPLTATTSVAPPVEKPGGRRRAAGSSSSTSGYADAAAAPAPAAHAARRSLVRRLRRFTRVAEPLPILEGRRENVRRSPDRGGRSRRGRILGLVFAFAFRASSAGATAPAHATPVSGGPGARGAGGPFRAERDGLCVSANPASCAVRRTRPARHGPGAPCPRPSRWLRPPCRPRVSTIDTPGNGVVALVAVPVIRHGGAAGRVCAARYDPAPASIASAEATKCARRGPLKTRTARTLSGEPA